MSNNNLQARLDKLRAGQERKQKATEKELRLIFKGLLTEIKNTIGEESLLLGPDVNLSYEELKKTGRLDLFLDKIQSTIDTITAGVPGVLVKRAETAYSGSWAGFCKASAGEKLPAAYQALAVEIATLKPEALSAALSKNELYKDYYSYSKLVGSSLVKKLKKEVRAALAAAPAPAGFFARMKERLQKCYRLTVNSSRTTTHTFTEAAFADAAEAFETSAAIAKIVIDKERERAQIEAEKIVPPLSPLNEVKIVPWAEHIPRQKQVGRFAKELKKLKNYSKLKNTTKAQLKALEFDTIFDEGAANNSELPKIRMYKTWASMKDSRVREFEEANHRKMNGEKVRVDEKFDLGAVVGRSGIYADSPGNSGDKSNDNRCRCVLIYDIEKVEE